jgi:putative glycosyltransferase (TIGR04372 family)
MKIRKLIIVINFIWALPLSIFIYVILNPFFLIRFGSIPIGYFGHFVGDLEQYLSEKDAGHHIPNKRYIDIWFVEGHANCNSLILKNWNKKIIIIPSFIGYHLKKCLEKILFSKVNTAKSYFYDRDIMGILKETNPHLELNEFEIQECIEKLKYLGIEEDKKIVTLTIRDNLHHIEKKFTNYRNGNINNLLETIKFLLDKDYIVIKMGTTNLENNFEEILNNKNYINYYNSDLRSEAMEIYLGSRCEFVISSGTGWDSIPTRVFRKPAIYIDYVQISSIPSWSESSIYIFKKLKLIEKDRFLNLEEIFYLVEENFDTNNPIFYQLGGKLELINNSSFEILNAVKDYLDKKQKTKMQSRYWSLFTDYINKYNLNRYHCNNMKFNKLHINIASSFIEDNSYLLDDVVGEDIKNLKKYLKKGNS